MALPSPIGSAARPGFLRLRLGVRGRLFAAFAVIAGMAIAISAGAGLVLGHLGGTMVDLTGRDIPRLAASLQLSAQSASLASQGPALLASRSEETLNEHTRTIKETQTVTLDKLGEIIELGADKSIVAALNETIKNIDDNIKSLNAAAREKLDGAAQHARQYDALRKAQADFVAAASPAMMDAEAQVNAILGSANLSADEHRRMFLTFLAGIIREFDVYLERGDIDLIRDGISYRLSGMWLSKTEAKKLARDLNTVLMPPATNTPTRGRKRWYFGSIVLPAPEHPRDA